MLLKRLRESEGIRRWMPITSGEMGVANRPTESRAGSRQPMAPLRASHARSQERSPARRSLGDCRLTSTLLTFRSRHQNSQRAASGQEAVICCIDQISASTSLTLTTFPPPRSAECTSITSPKMLYTWRSPIPLRLSLTTSIARPASA